MKSFRTSLLKSTIVAVILLSGFFVVMAVGTPTPPAGGPPGNQPLGFLTEDSTPQQKMGVLGIRNAPTPGYDLTVDGSASFNGGLWASTATIMDDVQIGPVGRRGGTSNVNMYGTLTHDRGTIQTNSLLHNENTPQPVCSEQNGKLALCTCKPIVEAPVCLTNFNYGGQKDEIYCNTVNDIEANNITTYEVEAYQPRWKAYDSNILGNKTTFAGWGANWSENWELIATSKTISPNATTVRIMPSYAPAVDNHPSLLTYTPFALGNNPYWLAYGTKVALPPISGGDQWNGYWGAFEAEHDNNYLDFPYFNMQPIMVNFNNNATVNLELLRWRARGVNGECKGPWGETNTQIPGPQGGGGDDPNNT